MRQTIIAAAILASLLASGGAEAQMQARADAAGISVATAPATAPLAAGPAFSDRDKLVVRGFYARQFARGFCPVGTTRKANGCVAASEQKAWSLGQRLDDQVAYYPVPTELRLQLRTPPGCDFVRVQNDVLLIRPADGTVLDAIADLR